jgi:hypothetical protein
MAELTNHVTHSLAARIASRLFALGAIGELTVGLAVLAFPGPVMGLLLAATLVGIGLVIARMLGIAVIALGMTWWLARNDLHRQLRRMAPGFIGYNLGVGTLFLLYALVVTRPVPLSWAVALVHLMVGLAFSATLVVRHRPARSGEAGPSLGAA